MSVMLLALWHRVRSSVSISHPFAVACCLAAVATGCLSRDSEGRLRSTQGGQLTLNDLQEGAKQFHQLKDFFDENFFNPEFNSPEQAGEILVQLDNVSQQLGLSNTTSLRFEYKAKRLARKALENPFDLLASWSQVQALPPGKKPLLSDRVANRLWNQPGVALEPNLFSKLHENQKKAGNTSSEYPVMLAGRDTHGKPGSIPVTRTEYRYSGRFYSEGELEAYRRSSQSGEEYNWKPETVKIRVRNYYDFFYDEDAARLSAANISAISKLLPNFAKEPVRFWEFKTTAGIETKAEKIAVLVKKYRLPVSSHDVRILANRSALEFALDQSDHQPNLLTGLHSPGEKRYASKLVSQVINNFDAQLFLADVQKMGREVGDAGKVDVLQVLLSRPGIKKLFANPYLAGLPLLSEVDDLFRTMSHPQSNDPGQAFADVMQKLAGVKSGLDQAVGKLLGFPEAQREFQDMLTWIKGFQARTFVLALWNARFLKLGLWSSPSQAKKQFFLTGAEAKNFEQADWVRMKPRFHALAKDAFRWSQKMIQTTDSLYKALKDAYSFPTQYIMQYKRLSFEVDVKLQKDPQQVYPVQITLDRDIELLSPVGVRYTMPRPPGSKPVYFDKLPNVFPPNMVVAEVKFPNGSQSGLEADPNMNALYWYRDQVLDGRLPEAKPTAGKNYVAADVMAGPRGRIVRAWDQLVNQRKYLELGYRDYQFDRIRGEENALTSLLSFAPLWEKNAREMCDIIGADERYSGVDELECPEAPDQPK